MHYYMYLYLASFPGYLTQSYVFECGVSECETTQNVVPDSPCSGETDSPLLLAVGWGSGTRFCYAHMHTQTQVCMYTVILPVRDHFLTLHLQISSLEGELQVQTQALEVSARNILCTQRHTVHVCMYLWKT